MKKILVIDEDAKSAQVLRIRLKSAGYEVLTARDEVGGLSLTREWEPDLVVLDHCVRVEGGIPLAGRLREAAPAARVMLSRAGSKEGLTELADHQGAVGCITKPYEPDEVLAAVARALQAEPGAPPGGSDPSKAGAAGATLGAAAGHSLAGQARALKPAAAISGRHKILIVEDDRNIALALATRLRAAGQDVLFAYDACHGLDAAVKNQPDLVLLDMCLPAGSGLALAERMRTVVPKLMPVIFMTASRQPALREQALALGAAGFLEKPFETDELMTMIRRAFQPADEAKLAAGV